MGQAAESRLLEPDRGDDQQLLGAIDDDDRRFDVELFGDYGEQGVEARSELLRMRECSSTSHQDL